MNNVVLFLLALVPIVLLMVSLGVLKIPAHKACTMVLGLVLVLAIVFWKMPILNAFTAALEGVVMAVWPIAIIIIAAIFTYNLALHTKSMDTIKNMLSGITTDKRIQVLILAWGFGGFLEAVAGYGTAVAIPASILAALGFEPIFAAVICLIANTVPTAFGAIGTPVISLAKIANIDVNVLSYYVGLQLVLFIIVVPMVLVLITTKSLKGLKGVMGISLASGISFAIPEVLAAKFMGAELPALLGSVCSMAVTIIIAKRMSNKVKATKGAAKEEIAAANSQISFKEGIIAWIPYILVFVFIILSSQLVPFIYNPLSHIKSSVLVYTGANAKHYDIKWIATPGTIILIATVLGGLIQGAKVGEIVTVFGKTCKQLTKSTITVISIVAMAKVMDYSGMIKNLAEMLVAITGSFYPLISSVIGALGTFVTGSDTSSNVLFGRLQTEVAASIHVNPVWLAAANTAGATAGKMISPQSIAVATAATGLAGAEGKILNKTLKFCAGYVIILGGLVYIGSMFIK
ncbi:lactate permease LctP family transporter [Clostridium sp. YIM B02515]|uniref:L-lactate permease n=1 Tax=Clostridium rhizosphaerae TaxID=2803861 RepID=A0ABS1THM8_9CLOT|nr:lactate permease LctP family transporter [Clostridium rhizosphaerae]MBL4938287.1 lactate permease LctP family transporter [Clostridium rhizosphaerae]